MEELNEVPQLIHGILEVTIFEAIQLHHLLHGTIIKVYFLFPALNYIINS